jgi:glycosyltransferase involved in cell wall biosynthesis
VDLEAGGRDDAPSLPGWLCVGCAMVTPFISVIIPVYNDAERLHTCLKLLEHQTYPQDRYEVIVVDNGSSDRPDRVVEQFNQVRFTSEAKRGSYAARNRGIALAQGEVLAFTDSDCQPAADWLEQGVATLLATPNCGLVGGQIKMLFQDPGRPTAVELYDSIKYLQQQHYIEVTKFGATANLFAWRKMFDTVGLFNAELQSGGDQEWGQRVHAAGYPLVYSEAAWIAHPARRSWPELYKKVVRVARGKYDIGIDRRESLREFWQEIAVELKPHLGTLRQECTDPRIKGGWQQFRFGMVVLLVRYARVWAKIQAKLGEAQKPQVQPEQL